MLFLVAVEIRMRNQSKEKEGKRKGLELPLRSCAKQASLAPKDEQRKY